MSLRSILTAAAVATIAAAGLSACNQTTKDPAGAKASMAGNTGGETVGGSMTLASVTSDDIDTSFLTECPSGMLVREAFVGTWPDPANLALGLPAALIVATNGAVYYAHGTYSNWATQPGCYQAESAEVGKTVVYRGGDVTVTMAPHTLETYASAAFRSAEYGNNESAFRRIEPRS